MVHVMTLLGTCNINETLTNCNLTILVDYFESYLQSRLTRLIIIFNAG
jgi:hypothetical protein